MSLSKSRYKRVLSSLLIYVSVLAATTFVASRYLRTNAEQISYYHGPTSPTAESLKPYFALSTHRTYSPSESARLWVSYRGIDSLDLRVYRINEPAQFFSQLNNPHQMGEEENEEVANNLKNHPSVLERVRGFKSWAYSHLKNYVRGQLPSDARKTFNQKFRATEVAKRQPLNVADFARVPLLNSNHLVTSWREPLAPLENEYDQRMIPLDKREPGVYLVEAVGGVLRAYTVVVVTNLAMVEKMSRDGEIVVYTVDRRTGEQRPNAQVQIVQNKKIISNGTTGNDGMARLRVHKPATDAVDGGEANTDDAENYIVLAKDRDNFAIGNLESFYFRGFQGDEEGDDNVRGYIYTDRPIYRPGHTVYFKGIIRGVDAQGGYQTLKDNAVTVVIKDANDAQILEKEFQLNARGTVSGEVTLSEEAPLGNYQVEVQTSEGTATGSFQVAEYKKPEYKVSVTTPKKFAPTGTTTKFSIDARYFFGSPVAGAEVKYYIYRSRYYPWFDDDDSEPQDPEDEDEYSQYTSYSSDLLVDSEGKLDASGHLDVEFKLPESDETTSGDYQYKLEAQVTDSARRTIEGAASLVATRGGVIARAIPERYVYNKGQTARLNINTIDYEGHPVPSNVTLKFIQRTWTKVDKKDDEPGPGYVVNETELSSAEVTTDRQGRANYDYPISNQGNIEVKTIIKEGKKEIASIGGYLWVTSPEERWSDSSYYSENYQAIKLVPDKKSYRAGETAHVLAILPDEDASLMVTTELLKVMSSKQVKVAGRSTVLDIPIVDSYAPNVFLNVTYVKKGEMYSSDQRLVVPATNKMLNLEIISNKKEYKPRETASYTVLARDQNGAPVPNAEISLGVVDEAIYSVAPDYSTNIRQEFYGVRYNEVETHLSISYTFTGYAGEKPIELARTKPAFQLADFKNESDLAQPMIRKLFKDTAYWQPNAVTGGDGRATVKFQLPDNLTTWRATARGVTADTKVGIARSKVLSRKDVIMRLETPRFITQGDTVTLSGIVHNYLPQTKATQISISVSGAQLIGDSREVVNIDKQGEHRVDWKISAPQTGQIKLLAKALTNTESDAVELTLDVVPRGVKESRNNNWNSAESNAEQSFTLDLPANADQNSRKLRIEVSPSITGSLFGALDYLSTYPYGCTEQTMSSFLPNAIVTQALKEVKQSSVRSSDELNKKSERGRDRLYAFQHADGGWGWWKNDKSDPFMTAYVIDGLTLAKRAGLEVDDERIQKGRQRLMEMLESGKTEAGDTIDKETTAFMVYALTENDINVDPYMNKLFNERNELQPYGRALLALALEHRKEEKRALQVANEIETSATADQSTAHWESHRKAMLDFVETNDTEATALSLKALSHIKPSSSLLPRAARWLVSNKRNSYYWSSTKDTAFAIFGLIDFVKATHELEASYDLEVYLNGATVMVEHVSASNSSGTFQVTKKGADVGATNQIRVVKRGQGNLFMSSSLEYYTDDENVVAQASDKLNVTREYQRLSVQPDGYKLKWVVSPLTGEIHSGDLIVVKLKLKGSKARHLMIEDPIPAGAEQLESVGNLNLDYTDGHWTDWYSSREFRDQRTVFFLDYFDGEATFQYAIRVLIPGDFMVAPARAERMYEPEVNTHTANQRFTFLDRQVSNH